MLNSGEIHLWRVRLNRGKPSPPTAQEAARAARFATPALRRRYLRAHSALRAILGSVTRAPLQLALHERGKPYLPMAPEIRFNLAHSSETALVAVARDVEVGVDIERVRPLPEYAAIAQRYFPPGYTAPTGVRDFFRHWTRFEALLKAHGAGLYGAGATPEGVWSITEIDAGPRFTAALAVEGPPLTVVIHDFGEVLQS
ncbi:MAG: 4'-phosphopantetheinyl transferase superfamily protein [Candidatus Solibacter sp.]|nr:4'-phosphopantetheinyl transferase superfamily protein [Candidatus Solibacter sp.]